MNILAEWILKSLTLLITAYIVPGFHIDSYLTALVVAVVLGILNLLLKPILVIFTLPVTILTLGLFMFVVNAVLLLIATSFVKGFRIDSLGSAILASIVITLISSLLNHVIK